MKIFCLLVCTMPLMAAPWVVGYSGAPGTFNCASTCHGVGAGTVVVEGFPETYVPDSTYLIRLVSTTSYIKNFNASCRLGDGSLNAGVMIGLASGNTASYNVPSETNGIHAAALDQDTLEFRWRAPVSGNGDATMYIAAHQATFSGPNNEFVLTATEQIADVPGDEGPFVGDYMLYPPYPNPFNSAVTFRMELIGHVPLSLNIYDINGRFVEKLFEGESQNGQNEFTWFASGAAGVYFVRAEINHTPIIYKILYLR